MTIGERIKQRRKELKLTQQELADKLGYKDRSAVCQVEKDKNNSITTDRIKAFADALDTTPGFLMGWTEEEEKIINHIKNELAAGAPYKNTFWGDAQKDKVFMEHIELLWSLPPEQRSEIYNYIKYHYYKTEEKKDEPLHA